MDRLLALARELGGAVGCAGVLRIVGAAAVPLSAATIAASVAEDDIERAASGGAVRARYLLDSGTMNDIAGEALGRDASAREQASLATLLADLGREGL